MEENQCYFLKYYTFTLLRDEELSQYSSTVSVSNLIKTQSPPDWFLYRCSGEGKIFEISNTALKYAEGLPSVR